MTDDDHKQLKPRADNLPAALQRSKQLLALNAAIRARTRALATADDGWFERLCAWADEFDIPEEELPRDKTELLVLQELRLSWKQLTTLPAAIGQLDNLQKLNL